MQLFPKRISVDLTQEPTKTVLELLLFAAGLLIFYVDILAIVVSFYERLSK